MVQLDDAHRDQLVNGMFVKDQASDVLDSAAAAADDDDVHEKRMKMVGE